MADNQRYLHINSPLLESTKLSNLLQAKVFLKMDSSQPSGSFKIRGLGYLCSRLARENRCSHFVIASGGNAGLAVAYSGRKLQIPVTVVVPETTPEFMRTLIQREGAQVVVHGKVWDDAHQLAITLCKDDTYQYIHPFDHPDVWTGHATLIEEVSACGVKPDVVITVVGGGGLLCGLLQGMHQYGWKDVPIIACETEGAASFHAALQQGKLVTLDSITTIARSLGTKTICKEALDWTKKHKIISHLVTDKMAVNAITQFADDQRTLVEPACGAGLAVVYEKAQVLMDILKAKENPTVLVVICGGNMVSLEKLKEWKDTI